MTDQMLAETLGAAGQAMGKTRPGPAALASPSYQALESRSAIAEGGFVKRMHPEMLDYFDVVTAIQAARQAGDAGAGPRVLWSDAETGALLMEYLGDGWTCARQHDLQHPAIVTCAMQALKQFHGTADLAVRFDPFAEIDRLIEAHEAEGVALPDDILWLRRVIGLAESLMDKADLAPCRNDGSSSNLMIGPKGKVLLVDFDRAGMNDPLYDVGCLLAEITDHEADMRAGYEAYAGTFDQIGFVRARLWSHVDDMLHALWSRLNAKRSERKSVEWIKYGEWRLLRLRLSLSHPLYEEKIRMTREAQ
ncbi:phosphotransferase [Roseovarius sp. CAU 1744]|uniref:phosphotransferase n=1 Tax=Roseovarius sp. CAU 1744 TaxID=3140368 RepID=UPI00325ACC89